jgi:hypothetical protein
MKNYGVSVIMSKVIYHIRRDGSKSLKEILNEAVAIMQDFLKITSLAHNASALNSKNN